MTTAGGKTTRLRARSGQVSFEIAIACSLLFDAFRSEDRDISVCGLPCDDRLQALQRIFEHELVHLTELLCFEHSNCGAPRFHEIAARSFAHRAHTHQLITRREQAVNAGLQPGAQVTFLVDGTLVTGRVNRITKRATVLVPDPNGEPYADGHRYRTYYVPIPYLRPVGNVAKPAESG
jgi:hypothetical protein